MKLQPLNYNTPQRNIKRTENSSITKNNMPSFGLNPMAPLVGLATFIENNGFFGEFISIDSIGMMFPRTWQGFRRNRKELGHLNYKAGREEAVRELLSGPAYFFVPLGALTLASKFAGKVSKVSYSGMNTFKTVLNNSSFDLKDANSIKSGFVDEFINTAFKDYTKGREQVEELRNLLKSNLNNKYSILDYVLNIFRSKDDKKVTASMVKKEAEAILSRLNKMNGKMLNSTSSVVIEGNQHNIKNVLTDMSNYFADFTKAASKTSLSKNEFVQKFASKAVKTRDIANLVALASLAAFLVIIPKIYQTGKEFPGTDGLKKNNEGGKNEAA